MRLFIMLFVAIAVTATLPTTQGRSNADRPSAVARLVGTHINGARNSYGLAWDEFRPYRQGKSDPERVYRWSRRWMEVELLTVHSRKERMSATRSHFKRMKQLRQEVAGDGTRSTLPLADLSATQFYSAEAELWLAKFDKK